jgi:hypothetical protein
MKNVGGSIIVAVLAGLASLFFFSPRLLVFTEEAPGSYEWTRGLNFLDQIKGQPHQEIEPALKHRLLPVYTAKILGLSGYEAFALGWAGVIVCLTGTNLLLRRAGVPNRVATSATFLLASTATVITSLGWLGIFDCWWVFALIVVALASRQWPIVLVVLLAPWIDERFLIGMPVAVLARFLVYPFVPRAAIRLFAVVSAATLPYVVWRLYSLLYLPEDASGEFLSGHFTGFVVWLRMVPHGWWMAYRLAWIVLLLPFALPNASGVKPWLIALCCLPIVFAVTVTAADITRSAMVLAPLMITGIVVAWRAFPENTARWLPWLAAVNFVVPYTHIVYNKTEPVHPLLWEIIRLIKKVS